MPGENSEAVQTSHCPLFLCSRMLALVPLSFHTAASNQSGSPTIYPVTPVWSFLFELRYLTKPPTPVLIFCIDLLVNNTLKAQIYFILQVSMCNILFRNQKYCNCVQMYSIQLLKYIIALQLWIILIYTFGYKIKYYIWNILLAIWSINRS